MRATLASNGSKTATASLLLTPGVAKTVDVTGPTTLQPGETANCTVIEKDAFGSLLSEKTIVYTAPPTRAVYGSGFLFDGGGNDAFVAGGYATNGGRIGADAQFSLMLRSRRWSRRAS